MQAASEIRTRPVRRIRAPEVRFPALVERDRNHPEGVASEVAGQLTWIRPSASAAIHVGDSAVVTFKSADHPPLAGHVEWIRPPGPGYRYMVEVGSRSRMILTPPTDGQSSLRSP
jgi:hypothetical protein